MKYVAVVPYTVQSIMDEFMKTCKLDNVLKIDNTTNNIGAMASHNLGVDKMYETESDWLVVISPAIRFGKPGGLDFIEKLKTTEYKIVESLGVFGWHLIAFHKDIIDKVGKWDTNFTPYGYDDLDYSMRIQRAFLLDYNDHWKTIKKNKTTWQKVKVDVKDTFMGHSIKLGNIDPRMSVTKKYYNKKWGIYPGTYTSPDNSYFYPFNDSEKGLGYFTNDYYNEWIKKESQRKKQIPVEVIVSCDCGNSFKSMSVFGNLQINVCAACYPDMEDGTKK